MIQWVKYTLACRDLLKCMGIANIRKSHGKNSGCCRQTVGCCRERALQDLQAPTTAHTNSWKILNSVSHGLRDVISYTSFLILLTTKGRLWGLPESSVLEPLFSPFFLREDPGWHLSTTGLTCVCWDDSQILLRTQLFSDLFHVTFHVEKITNWVSDIWNQIFSYLLTPKHEDTQLFHEGRGMPPSHFAQGSKTLGSSRNARLTVA